jgi:hypothetical protein
MKTLKLLIPGLVSSALLSIGLSRLALTLDPLAQQVRLKDGCMSESCAPCVTPCFAPVPSSLA